MGKLPDKHGFSGYLLVLFIALSLFVLLQEQNPGINSVSVEETLQLIERDSTIVLLDVRNPDEWTSSTGHLKNALLIPLQELDAQRTTLEPFRNRRIIAYCRSGTRSIKAARMLAKHGFNVLNMRGGMREWNSKELPIIQEIP